MSDSSSTDEVLQQILDEMKAIHKHLESIDESLTPTLDEAKGLRIGNLVALLSLMVRQIRDEFLMSVPVVGAIGTAVGTSEIHLRSIAGELRGSFDEGEPSVRRLLGEIASSVKPKGRHRSPEV